MTVLEQIKDLSKVQIGLGALVAGFSALGGAALGAKLAMDKFSDKLREEADEALQAENEKLKAFYKTLHKVEEYETPQAALEALHPEATEAAAQAMINYQGMSAQPIDVVEVAKNVFTDSVYIPAEFDYEKEMAQRDPDRPYILTEEEFMEAALSYEQTNFTYYAGDGVLANARDEEITGDLDKTVGADNLMRFGHGSNDENIVYIRNVLLEMDVEIARSPGKYSEEVAGFIDDEPATELKHSHSPRKFRHQDD